MTAKELVLELHPKARCTKDGGLADFPWIVMAYIPKITSSYLSVTGEMVNERDEGGFLCLGMGNTEEKAWESARRELLKDFVEIMQA